MSFHIDLTKISLDSFKQMLLHMQLIPSWKILLNQIDNHFDIIQNRGITNLEELQKALSSKKKIEGFSQLTDIPTSYLTVLVRVVKGYQQKPIKLGELITIGLDVDSETLVKLEAMNIRNTKDLYEVACTTEQRNQLAEKVNCPTHAILALTRLSDLTRIKWVNHTFAYLLLLSGYHSVLMVSEADPIEMYERVKRTNEEKQFNSAPIGLKDMKMVIESSQLLDFEVEF